MKLNKIVSTLAAIATVAMFASCGSSEAPAASEVLRSSEGPDPLTLEQPFP